jgi:hypothetical protein
VIIIMRPMAPDPFPAHRRALLRRCGAGLFTTFVGPGSAGSVIDSRAFGAVGDGKVDETQALLAWAAAVANARGDVLARLAPGVYRCAAELKIASPELRSIRIEAEGAEIVVTAPPARSKRYFRVANTAQVGGACHLRGLAMRHDRPTVRMAGTDMVSLAGFAEYEVEAVTVASADNMGITVGRGDPKGFSPRRLVMRQPVVGGRYEVQPHSHGSVGDTGIWVVNAPQSTEITDAKVQGTGDDGILVGHAHSPAAGNCHILNADVRDAGANGIVVAVPRGRITGRVERTNGSGVALIRVDGAQGSHMRVEVDVRRPGWLQPGDIGTAMIPKRNPWGIWIWQGGEDGGRIDLDGSRVSDAYASAITLQPYKDGSLAGIRGKVTCRDIGTAPGAVRAKAAVLRRAPSAGHVEDVDLDLDVERSAVPLVSWSLASAQPDRGIAMRIMARRCEVDPAFAGRALVDLPGIPAEPALQASSIRVVAQGCAYGDVVRVARGALAAVARVDVR